MESDSNISSIKTPKMGELFSNPEIQIHGFCNASEKAYGAAIYLRVQDASFQVNTHTLLAKTKVAPVKIIFIPGRLSENGGFFLAQISINYQGLYQ